MTNTKSTTPSEKPQVLRGFRDFLPLEKRQRDFVERKIQNVFERAGFAPLETPTLEYASLLLGKYGAEADKLIYSFEDRGERRIGLRYDQTVPTARVLVEYQNVLPKYFRRYQIQNVFRADKPQKGRYREFKQCDCDLFGSTNTLADAEVLAVFANVYREIGFTDFVIELNDRQTLLATLSPFATPEVNVYSIIQSIDKLDKMTPAEVVTELTQKGLETSAASQAVRDIEKAEMSDNLSTIVQQTIALGVPAEVLKFNPKIARGLDYYTGLIFEGKIPKYGVGSVGGGGRYDNLIRDLSGMELPAVGFAVGFDRTVEAAVQLGLVPQEGVGTQVLVTIFDETLSTPALQAAAKLRAANIFTEVFPTVDKLGKQFKLADQKKIPYVLIIGEEEQRQGKVTLKEMASGEQRVVTIDEAIETLLS